MKTYNIFKKEFPELDLKITVKGDNIIFTGNRTPIHLIGNSVIYNKNDITLYSISYPSIGSFNGKVFKLFVGGNTDNPPTFRLKTRRYPFEINNLNIILNKHFRTPELNVNIKVL